MKRILIVLITFICSNVHAQDINLYQLLNPDYGKGPQNVRGSITMQQNVVNCYVDPHIYPINYTANGYTCNKTLAEIDILKKENLEFLNSNYKPIVFNDSVVNNLIKKLQFRELEFDKYNPILDYYNVPSPTDTVYFVDLIFEYKRKAYIKKPIGFYDYEYKNSKIDELYQGIILAKTIDSAKLKEIVDEITKKKSLRVLFNRLIQYYDFCVQNGTLPLSKGKQRIDEILNLAVKLEDSSHFAYKNEILNNIAIAYYKMGERNKCYKTLLYALESYKYLKQKTGIIYNDNYNTVRLLKALFYQPDVKNYFLDNKYSNLLNELSLLSWQEYTTPIRIFTPYNNMFNTKWNYNFLLERGIVEYYKLSNYTIQPDSIKNYSRIIIMNTLITHYKNSIRDSFELDEDVLADLNYVFGNYLRVYHNNNTNFDMYAYYSYNDLMHSLNNFDYIQYQNRLINFLDLFTYNKQTTLSKTLIDRIGGLTDMTNDHRLYAELLYQLANTYIQENKMDSVEVVYNAIIRHRDTVNIDGKYYYDKALAKVALLKAQQKNDPATIDKANLYLKTNYESFPVKEINDFAEIESQFKLEKEYKKEVELRKIAESSEQRAHASEIEAIKQKDIAEAQTKIAQEKEKEAKEQEGIASRRLDTILHKDNLLRLDSLELAYKNKQLIADTVVLHNKNIELATSEKKAKNWRNGFFIALILALISLCFAVVGWWQQKNTNKYLEEERIRTTKLNIDLTNKNTELEEVKIKNLETESDKQKAIIDKQQAEANLAHKLLTIHNFKGINLGKRKLETFNLRNKIVSGELLDISNILQLTGDYIYQLLINLRKFEISLVNELENLRNYFEIELLAENLKIDLIIPKNNELENFKDFKIISNTTQPIIENILEHTNIKKTKNATISVSIEKISHGVACLFITDNSTETTQLSKRSSSENKNTGMSLILLEETINKSSSKIMKYEVPDFENLKVNLINKFYLYSE